MIPAFLRWLSLSFCLLLSWALLAVPQTRLPQPALTIQTEAAGEKEAQLQSAETLNKKKRSRDAFDAVERPAVFSRSWL